MSKEYIMGLPKTTIAAIISAIIIYLLWEWYIDTNLAYLFQSVLLALGISINIVSGKLISK